LAGFNGDLSTTLGPSFIFPTEFGWSGEIVPALSEGSGALKITHNTNWQPGLKLTGVSNALAQIVATHDTLEFDLAPNPGMSWRQGFAIINGNDPPVGWSQSPEINLTVPAPFDHLIFDLTDARGDGTATTDDNWKAEAIAWLALPAAQQTYYELFIGFQGQDLPGTPVEADFDLDGDVDNVDFTTFKTSFGTDAGADTNFDGVTDGLDFLKWQEQFTGVLRPFTIIDNIVFKGPAAGAGAVPEPATLGLLGAAIALAMGVRGRRTR
jgi:hypothetical protein